MFDALADSEVSDLDFPLGIDEDVLGLYVPVDGVSDGVDVVQPREDLAEVKDTWTMMVAISA